VKLFLHYFIELYGLQTEKSVIIIILYVGQTELLFKKRIKQ